MSVPQWHTHETGLCNGWLYRPDATVSRSLGPPKARHRSRSSCQIYGLQLKKKKKLRPWSVETSVVTTCSSFKKKSAGSVYEAYQRPAVCVRRSSRSPPWVLTFRTDSLVVDAAHRCDHARELQSREGNVRKRVGHNSQVTLRSQKSSAWWGC